MLIYCIENGQLQLFCLFSHHKDGYRITTDLNTPMNLALIARVQLLPMLGL